MINANDLIDSVKRLLNYEYDESQETDERLILLINAAINSISNAGVDTPSLDSDFLPLYIICVAQYVTLVDENDVDISGLQNRFHMNLSSLRGGN